MNEELLAQIEDRNCEGAGWWDDVPDLVAEVRSLRGENERLTSTIDCLAEKLYTAEREVGTRGLENYRLNRRVEAWKAMAEYAFECININEYHIGDEVTIQPVRPGEWDDLWGLFDIARKLEEES